jgi:hypothetical protein
MREHGVQFGHAVSLFDTCFISISCLPYSSISKMESRDFERSAWRYSPEDGWLPPLVCLG